MTQTVENTFNANDLRALLEPGARYTISVTYLAEAREERENGVMAEASETITQHFSFMTDTEPPERMDPWVMATTPHDGDVYHFTDDLVQIYFNDEAAIQLYEKYGKTLQAVLRNANGSHPATQPPVTLQDLLEVDPLVLPPFYEYLQELVEELSQTGGCFPADLSYGGHRVLNLDIPLERGTAYTLDIETDDPPPGGSEPQPRLFRIAFKTSRYSGAAELGAIIFASATTNRRMKNPLPALDDRATDQDIQNALLSAGLEAVPPATQPAIIYLWDATDQLVAVMIDSPEPLWRSRAEPIKRTVENEGADMIHWVMESKQYLEIVDLAGTVSQLVRSPGGARTLALLNPGATQLDLVLRQHDHTLTGETTTVQDHPLLTVALSPQPPWRLTND
jgi:hypothetical protein